MQPRSIADGFARAASLNAENSHILRNLERFYDLLLSEVSVNVSPEYALSEDEIEKRMIVLKQVQNTRSGD